MNLNLCSLEDSDLTNIISTLENFNSLKSLHVSVGHNEISVLGVKRFLERLIKRFPKIQNLGLGLDAVNFSNKEEFEVIT